MLEAVRRTLHSYDMIQPGELVMVGVSGGPDSIALLHSLHRLSGEFGFRLHVVHVNHGLRPEAEEEASFVVDFARDLGVSACVQKLDPKLLKGASLQEAARDARRRLFLEECKITGATKIALGHNANDQAETVLQRLFRGGGTGGLGGIHPVREQVIRPLLFVKRSRIEEYLEEEKLQFRVDRSNFKPVYLRNKIRLELIPRLEMEYNRRLVETLGKTAVILQEDEAYLQAEAEKNINDFCQSLGDNYLLPMQLFSLPKPISSRIVRLVFGQLAGDPRGLEYDHVNRVLALAQTGRSGSCLELPDEVRVYKEQDGMLFCSGLLSPEALEEQIINVPGETRIPALRLVLRARLVQNPDFFPLPEGSWSIVLDYDQLGTELKLRGRVSGDKILVNGSYRKLKEIFIERRIPIRLRETSPLVVQADEVIWIPGLMRSDRAKVLPGTTRVLELAVSKY